jgi:putative transposase
MTYDFDCTLPDAFLEPILEHGLDVLPELIRAVVNAAMELERQQHLGVAPYERSEKRRGYANGFKSKTVATRLGKITFDVPQVREGDFYPSALEKASAASGP